MQFKSSYRFPYNFTKDYFHPSYYIEYVKYKWQRAQRGYSDRDLWSFDWYLANMLVMALPNFKNSESFVVYLLKEDLEKYNWDEMEEEEQSIAMQRWDDMIDNAVLVLSKYTSDEAWVEEYNEVIAVMHTLSDNFGALWI